MKTLTLTALLSISLFGACANDGGLLKSQSSNGILRMGMNISDSPYYFSHNLMFNDVMKTASTFRNLTWNENLDYELASDGYPREITLENYSVRAVLLINNIYTGDYVFLYDGDGDITFNGGVQVTSTALNKIHLRLTAPDLNSAGGQRWLTVTRSNRNNHARNFRLIPKEFEFNEGNMPLFRRDFLDGIKDMHALRFMDSTKSNNSGQVHWAERAQTTDFSFSKHGLPWEYLIELSNTLDIDGWFCVPHTASDDYIQNLARLIKQRLNKNLKAYVEYSNEIWNSGFDQYHWIANNAPNAANTYVSSNLRALESQVKFEYAMPVKTAYMMARTFRIFENEFSGDDRQRLVTVGAIHTHHWIEYIRETIEYWQKNNCMPDAIAGAGYFGFETSSWDDTAIPQSVIRRSNAEELNAYFHNRWNANPSRVTPNDIIDAVYTLWDHTIAPAVTASVQLIKSSGAKYIVYEGGQHMQPHNQGVWAYNQAVYDAQISPRMYNLYMKNFELHASLGCELFMNFTYLAARESQWGSWGVLENVSDVYSNNLRNAAPKYKAIIDANIRN